MIDRNHKLRLVHSCHMLYSAGDSERQIDVWPDDLSGQADLLCIRRITCIDRCAARAKHSPHRGSQPSKQCKPFSGADTCAAGNNPSGCGQMVISAR